MIVFILQIIIIYPIFVFCIVIIFWLSFVRPKINNSPVRDVLILAAHPDDCVIMAGEYGIKALQSGKTVNIIYMTCGDINADSDYAKTRRLEALHAWSKAKLLPEFIKFLDAPESKMLGRANQNDICKTKIKNAMLKSILELPIGAAIFIPAAGESHVDHRTLRKLAITAVLESSRHDIDVYEAPEYSNFCSLICNPFCVVRNIFRLIPGGGRIAGHINLDTSCPHFTKFGFGAMKLPIDERILQLKCEMLRTFVSQGSSKMEGFFCRPGVFRNLNVNKAFLENDHISGIELKGYVHSKFTFLFIISSIVSVISLVFLLSLWTLHLFV